MYTKTPKNRRTRLGKLIHSMSETAEQIPDTDININSIFEKPNQFLGEDSSQSETRDFQCPEINIKIQNVKTNALIDSGSKISAINETFYNKHKQNFNKCAILPLPGLTAVGFTGERSHRLKVKIFAEINFQKIT